MSLEDVPAPSEPVDVEFTYTQDGRWVLLLVVGAETRKVYWHLKFHPETAREAALKLTKNSLECEDIQKSSGG